MKEQPAGFDPADDRNLTEPVGGCKRMEVLMPPIWVEWQVVLQSCNGFADPPPEINRLLTLILWNSSENGTVHRHGYCYKVFWRGL